MDVLARKGRAGSLNTIEQVVRALRFAGCYLEAWRRIAGLLLCAIPLLGADEATVKAAFVYNFTKYVEWPSDSFAGPAAPFALCVFGRGTIASQIQAAIEGKKSAGRALELRVLANPAEAGACHVLYLADDEAKSQQALAAVRGRSVLTVGESGNFTARGGIFRLKLEDGRVRMIVDVQAAERSRLRISSRLLSLAEVSK